MKSIIRYSSLFILVIVMGAGSEKSSPEEVVLDHCLVTASSDIELAAPMSGVVKSIPVREGSEVSDKELVMVIDDTQAEIGSRLAEMTWKQATERSEDTSGIEFSKATASVAESEYYRALETNKSVPQAISQMQIEKFEMEMKKARIGVEKAAFDQKQAAWEKQIREKEMQVAKASQDQHYLKSPVEGTVVKKNKSIGEWVMQGESVFRIVNLKTMVVEGYLDLTRNDLQEVVNRDVQVDIHLARNRTVTLPGKIVHVNMMVQSGDKVLVKAELQNRRENGDWIIIPGMSANMRIQLDSSGNSRQLPVTRNLYNKTVQY